jgi:hypothetical protein
MRNIVAGHEAADDFEFVELGYLIDRELFSGVPGESAEERTARLDVAHDVLADLRKNDPPAAREAVELLRTSPVPFERSTATDLAIGVLRNPGKTDRTEGAA